MKACDVNRTVSLNHTYTNAIFLPSSSFKANRIGAPPFRATPSVTFTSSCVRIPAGGYNPPVTFRDIAQAGNSVRLKRGVPQVVMASMTTATPIRLTPKPAFTMSLICTWP